MESNEDATHLKAAALLHNQNWQVAQTQNNIGSVANKSHWSADLIGGKHFGYECNYEEYLVSFFRVKWIFFGCRPLDLCCCQFEGENICSKDLHPPASMICSSDLVEKVGSRAQNWLQRPNDPRPATKMPPISYIWITGSCLPIVPFKSLRRTSFYWQPSSLAISSRRF